LILNSFSEYTLVLAAHGSEAAPNSNAPIFDLASQIEAMGLFANVRCAFLMGQPNMTNVLDGLPAGKVIVVPLMTSVGYYLNSVIPGKLAQNTKASEFDWHISPVAGMHPRVATLMCDRIRGRLNEYQIDESETTLALIGHGTRRNKKSAKSTFDLFEVLKATFPKIRARVAFLDQDPQADLVAASILTGHTLIVPFLVSRGPHTTVDVPEAFGLPSGPDVEFPIVQDRGGRKCILEMPIGMYPEMAEICIELATDAVQQGHKLNLPTLEATT
jgi:sirohydrochlorin cobaltochelatase